MLMKNDRINKLFYFRFNLDFVRLGKVLRIYYWYIDIYRNKYCIN